MISYQCLQQPLTELELMSMSWLPKGLVSQRTSGPCFRAECSPCQDQEQGRGSALCCPVAPGSGDVCPAAKQTAVCWVTSSERDRFTGTGVLGWMVLLCPTSCKYQTSLICFFFSVSRSHPPFLNQLPWDFEADKSLPGLNFVPLDGSVPVSKIFSIICS